MLRIKGTDINKNQMSIQLSDPKLILADNTSILADNISTLANNTSNLPNNTSILPINNTTDKIANNINNTNADEKINTITPKLSVNLISYGFDYGPHKTASPIYSVLTFPERKPNIINTSHKPNLLISGPIDGRSRAYQEFIMFEHKKQYSELKNQMTRFLCGVADFNQAITIGIMDQTGKNRSVAIAEILCDDLSYSFPIFKFSCSHRDVDKPSVALEERSVETKSLSSSLSVLESRIPNALGPGFLPSVRGLQNVNGELQNRREGLQNINRELNKKHTAPIARDLNFSLSSLPVLSRSDSLALRSSLKRMDRRKMLDMDMLPPEFNPLS